MDEEKYELTEYEQETIFNYNNAEEEADIYSCDKDTIELIRKLAEDYPEKVRITRETSISIDATMPKQWIKIVPITD